MIRNQASVGPGIGRFESESDVFVVTRKPRMPELIYNNNRHKDLYWEIDQGDMWRVSHQKNPTNECFLCQKHKYAMIFIEKFGDNSDLQEIKDSEIIRSVQQHLNLNDQSDEYAPIICGSVVDGGFERKLQMLRSDYYSLMSVAASDCIVKTSH